jgi:glutaredoxin domain-containing cysteine-rich protein 1
MGCGGARFVPCWECGGSCKVVVGDGVERCGKCNENGLIMCPICH